MGHFVSGSHRRSFRREFAPGGGQSNATRSSCRIPWACWRTLAREVVTTFRYALSAVLGGTAEQGSRWSALCAR